MQYYLHGKLWRWLWRKHGKKMPMGCTNATIYDQYGLMKLT